MFTFKKLQLRRGNRVLYADWQVENLDSYMHIEVVKDVFLFMDICMSISQTNWKAWRKALILQSIAFKLEMRYQEVTVEKTLESM